MYELEHANHFQMRNDGAMEMALNFLYVEKDDTKYDNTTVFETESRD